MSEAAQWWLRFAIELVLAALLGLVVGVAVAAFVDGESLYEQWRARFRRWRGRR